MSLNLEEERIKGCRKGESTNQGRNLILECKWKRIIIPRDDGVIENGNETKILTTKKG